MVRRVVLRLFPTSSTAALLRLGALAVLCLGVASVLPAAASAAGSGPVAAYSFDEDKGEAIEDQAGENDGIVEGAQWTPHGHYGGAMEYLGYESCVKVPDSTQLRGGEEFTLEAWVRPTTVHEFMPIFYKQRGEDYAYGLWFDEVADGKPEGEINDGTYPLPTVKAEADVPLDAWSHVALTFDGAHMRLYVDGQLVATAASAEPLESEGPLDIGCASVYGNEDHFEGRIDEARVYDRALSQAEVAADMETPLQTPKAGPVAEWSFDEGKGTTATDLTGHGHTATISKATWTRGRFGDALKFDGKSSCVTVAASPELDFEEEFTLEAWVRPVGTKENSGPLMAQIDEAPSPGEESFAYNFLAGENEVPHAWVRKAGGGIRSVYGTELLSQNAWSHLVLTDDGAHLRLYVDGELVNTAPATSPIGAEGPLQIGCHTSEYHFEGRIDEVRLYNRAITEAEVASDMEAPVQTPKTGPVADYSFDEGSGETAEDLTGNGHTATLQGAEWTTNGRYGGALEFKAANEDFVSIPASSAFNGTEELTVEAWVRPTASSGWGSILMKEREGSGPRYSYALFQHNESAGGRFHDSEEGELSSLSHSLPANAWAHLAITDNGAASHLYLNGVLVDTMPALPIEGNGEIRLGGNDVFGDYFSGRIDELRIYDRSLTPAEVAVDMESPLVTPKAGPVASYSFDEENEATQADTSGHGHTATVEGAKWTSHGRYGGAMELDGKENCISIEPSTELQLTEELTLEAWVRPEGEGLHGVVTQEDETAAGSEDPFAYTLLSGDEENEGPRVWVRHPGGERGVAGGPTIPENAWSHLAVTDDGAHLRFYVDGELSSTEPAVPLTTTHGPLTLGCIAEYGDYFKGRIDEVRVYNRALNVGEVDADMEAPILTPKRKPVAAWSFDEGAGEIAEDVTGHGHEATVEGAEWVKGKYGSALRFNGTSACVSVSSSEAIHLGEEFTLEGWVKPEGSAQQDPLIVGSSLGLDSWGLGAGLTGQGRPEGGINTVGGGQLDVSAENDLDVGAWSHLTLTFDGSKLRLYVDGNLTASEPAAAAETGSNAAVSIGCDPIEGTYFKGRIDEVRVYDRALGPAEVLKDRDSLSDYKPPTIILAGPATEEIAEGPGEYPLWITAEDGTKAHPQSGVGKISVFVDGEEVRSVEQACPNGNCPLTTTWVYKPQEYASLSSLIEVRATDIAGNSGTESHRAAISTEEIRRCTASESGAPTPYNEEEMEGGGTRYLVHRGPDLVEETPVPPSGFVPTEASDEELAEYGFPPRPASGAERSEWQEVMNKYTGSANVPPNPCGGRAPQVNRELTHLEIPVNTKIWSGLSAIAPINESFTSVSSQFAVEKPKPTSCGEGSVSTWVGLGGTEGRGLIQAGTEILDNGTIGAWYEWVGKGPHSGVSSIPIPDEELHFAPNAAQEVYVHVWWQNSNDSMHFFIMNLKTGKAKSKSPHIEEASRFYDGETGDFVDERHGHLVNFGHTVFGLDHLVTNKANHFHLGDLPRQKWILKPANRVLAEPEGVVSGGGLSFVDSWLHC